jgi:hypothetical protein
MQLGKGVDVTLTKRADLGLREYMALAASAEA